MIHILSEQTINQIAAGEVIENPTSVVKELVENALDAGANYITIEISAGGMQLIRVSDNGSGMDREDALLSIKRHATSKLTEAKDLFELRSLGFRGEALASIAAISKFTLMTAKEDREGTKIEVEGGEEKLFEPFARTKGTTIEVRSLFYNVPARKKFQKSTTVSASEIFKLATIFGLSHPEVSFELISNGKKTISAPSLSGQDFEKALSNRLLALLGEDYASSNYKMQFSQGALTFQGVLGSPSLARPTKTGQYLFINRRAITCPLIQETIKESYGTRIAAQRHPIFLLHFSIPPDLVDVNVHPQKREVRLRDERFFREKIGEAMQRTLKDSVSLSFQPSHDFIDEAPFEPSKIQGAFLSMKFQEEKSSAVTELSAKTGEPREIGLFAHYLFLEGWSVNPEYDGVLIVDLQLALRRVAFEEYLRNDHLQKEKQGLIIPYTLMLSSIDAAMVMTHLPAIESIGFSLHPIGKDIFMIDAIPPFLNEKDAKEAIVEMALELQAFIGKQPQDEKKRKQLAYIASCRAKLQKQYSRQEALLLFKELLGSSSPQQCPKGNPTMVHLNSYEISRLFNK
ncbi:MAG TPA: DNA mismatch repair endonuclease MutL [Rhabdochlamydiaceae bacterium]|nr:DNA mismatch repair endonuclease MutL [Rhabdochlamydiaceae bacterium]